MRFLCKIMFNSLNILIKDSQILILYKKDHKNFYLDKKKMYNRKFNYICRIFNDNCNVAHELVQLELNKKILYHFTVSVIINEKLINENLRVSVHLNQPESMKLERATRKDSPLLLA